MSDRVRTCLGILFCAAGLGGCLLAALFPLKEEESFTLRGEESTWHLQPLETAEAGSVPVNRAGVDALTELPGIGPALGQLIVEEREKNGVYYFPEDLTGVRGIGLKKLEGFREMLDMRAEESGEK